MPATPNDEHPVEYMFQCTRAAWERYTDMSTPWPDDWPNRCRLIAHRMAINRTRIELLQTLTPFDVSCAAMLRTLRRDLAVDQATLDEHGYVPS